MKTVTCNECGAIATHTVPEDGEEPTSFWCYKHSKNRIDARLIRHWENPCEDAVPVPIEELAECHMALNQPCRDVDGTTFILTKERILEHWKGKDGKVDAYILPCPSGWHCIGIRYGNEGSQYLSPAGDKDKVTALLRKYT